MSSSRFAHDLKKASQSDETTSLDGDVAEITQWRDGCCQKKAVSGDSSDNQEDFEQSERRCLQRQHSEEPDQGTTGQGDATKLSDEMMLEYAMKNEISVSPRSLRSGRRYFPSSGCRDVRVQAPAEGRMKRLPSRRRVAAMQRQSAATAMPGTSDGENSNLVIETTTTCVVLQAPAEGRMKRLPSRRRVAAMQRQSAATATPGTSDGENSNLVTETTTTRPLADPFEAHNGSHETSCAKRTLPSDASTVDAESTVSSPTADNAASGQAQTCDVLPMMWDCDGESAGYAVLTGLSTSRKAHYRLFKSVQASRHSLPDLEEQKPDGSSSDESSSQASWSSQEEEHDEDTTSAVGTKSFDWEVRSQPVFPFLPAPR